jgi:hypothetical protein
MLGSKGANNGQKIVMAKKKAKQNNPTTAMWLFLNSIHVYRKGEG